LKADVSAELFELSPFQTAYTGTFTQPRHPDMQNLSVIALLSVFPTLSGLASRGCWGTGSGGWHLGRRRAEGRVWVGVSWHGSIPAATATLAPGKPGPRQALQVFLTRNRKGFNSPQNPYALPRGEAAVLPGSMQKS